MSETPIDVGGDPGPAPPDGDFSIKKIYCKDISFETPNSPAVFQSTWKPQADVDLMTEAKSISADEYEVVLMVSVTLNVSGKTAFLAEVKHAGIFAISGRTPEELAPVLGSTCPSILFPYVRELVSDLVIRGGFPPFILAPVNFEALYQKHLAEQYQEQAAARKSQT